MRKQVEIIKKYSAAELDCFILALINSPSSTIANLLKTYFKGINSDMYIDEDSQIRVKIISDLAKIISKSKANTRDEVIALINFTDPQVKSVYEDLLRKPIYAAPYTKELLEEKLKSVENTINNSETTILLRDVSEIYTKILTEDYYDWKQVNDICSNICTKIKTNFIMLDDTNALPNVIDFSDPDYIDAFAKKYTQITNDPSNIIKTGIKMLNYNMLGGGFRSDRLYVVLAPSKNGKSLFLQDACHWAIKYNNIQSSKGMIPIVLYLSFENGPEDFTNRLIKYGTGLDKLDDESEYARIFKENCCNPNTGCSIQFEFRPNESMSTADIDAYIDELERENKEVVMLVVDYIGRIRPMDKKVDRRFQLSDISNELRNIATSRHIPVLSAAQTNRNANIDLDHAATFAAKCEVATHFGTSYIGDSIGIAQNCDFMISIARIKDIHINEDTNTIESTDDYWCFKSCLNRVGQDNIDHFYHRFENGAKPIEDVNEPVASSVVTFNNLITDTIHNSRIKVDPNSGRRII